MMWCPYTYPLSGLSIPIILQPHLRKEKQAEDSDLVLLKKWLGDPPTDNEIAAESPRLKVLWTHRDRITLVDGVLWYSWLQDGDERQLFIIPDGMKDSVLKLMITILRAILE